MNKILFFDDFIVSRTDSTRRIFKTPKWFYDKAYNEPFSGRGVLGESVVPAPGGGYYMYYVTVPKGVEFSDEELVISMAYSENGLDFQPLILKEERFKGISNALGRMHELIGMYVYYDEEEENSDRRYKAACARYGKTQSGIIDEAPIMLYSSDGVNWKKLNDSNVVKSYVDCAISLLKNPITGKYQATTRRRRGERRICLVESEDLNSWTEPRCIVHPLPTDEPSTHLYGMPEFYYKSGDIFLGMLWVQIMPYNRVMDGIVYTEYAYSYDGLMWNRTFSHLFPHKERGELGCGSDYCFSIIEREDDILMYANILEYEHGYSFKDETEGRPGKVVVPGVLRKDGFVCLDSGKGIGEITTQALKLFIPELKLNVKAPLGGVRAQLCTTDHKPIEGFSYKDCDEIKGDYISKELKWIGGNLSNVMEKHPWIRLQVTFEQAELYSISGDFAFTINTKAPICKRL